MRLGNLNCSIPVLLAPLAGVSNRPFRVLAIRAGAAATFTEMVSSEGVVRSQKKTLQMMEFKPDEQPIGIQLFGANPEVMGRAAAFTAKVYRPDFIDINLGCPVKKVVNKNGGAAVLKDLGLTKEIIQATVDGAAGIPVMIKIRTGWDDIRSVYVEVGQIAQECGVQAVTLHARSRAKGFSGKADWLAIKQLKQAIDIPVIGNGDVFTPQDAALMFEQTGCDGIMIGRAAMGNPFIFQQMNHFLRTGQQPEEPSVADKMAMARLHAQLVVEEYGEERGVVRMRKYLGWYARGFKGASALRPRLFLVTTLAEIEHVLKDHMASNYGTDAEITAKNPPE